MSNASTTDQLPVATESVIQVTGKEPVTMLDVSYWFAGFCGEERVTAWYRNSQKPWSIMRRRARERKGTAGMTVRRKAFLEVKEIK